MANFLKTLTPKDWLMGATSITTLGSTAGAVDAGNRAVDAGNRAVDAGNKTAEIASTIKQEKLMQSILSYIYSHLRECVREDVPLTQCKDKKFETTIQHFKDIKGAVENLLKKHKREIQHNLDSSKIE